MHIVVHDQLCEIDTMQWNALVANNNPFLRHEFLHGLEETDCVSKLNGWQPKHIALYANDNSTLLGAMPCYIKEHSYGEYIFDWSWVNAYHRNWVEYYPKLSNAVPFTPATGPRILIKDSLEPYGLSPEVIFDALVKRAIALVDEHQLSSFHSLFCTEHQAALMKQNDMLCRSSTQFHWENRDYNTFDDFLDGMSSKKRKNIKRERRRVKETGIQYRWLSGDALDQAATEKMHAFYAQTIAYYGAQSYLNKRFFEWLSTRFSSQTLFLFAEFGDETIAGGLYFKSNNTLYGRYWGALANFHSVHFETCYYQAIDWCIDNNYQRFEAGAQGEHKLARGLEPNTTFSAHYIAHPEFRMAISDFLTSEKSHIDEYQSAMQSHSPFKNVEV